MILHLVNITGFSGNTYFAPLRQRDIVFKIESDFEPSKVWSMISSHPVKFQWEDGVVSFALDELHEFEAIVIEK